MRTTPYFKKTFLIGSVFTWCGPTSGLITQDIAGTPMIIHLKDAEKVQRGMLNKVYTYIAFFITVKTKILVLKK